MRVENQPYGRLNEIIYDHAFTTHPYKHPTIGSMADLEAASIAGRARVPRHLLRAGERRRRVVGDFDSAQATAAGAAVLRPRAEGGAPVPRDIPQEPAQTQGAARATVEEAWPLPAVVVAYHVIYDGHPDSYPLHITSKILSDGESARIPRELVYNKRLALTAFGSGNITEDPNLFYAVAIVQPGQPLEAAERALIAEFERLKSEPVTERRIAAREEPVRARLHHRPRDGRGQGAAPGHAAVIHNDITTADGEFDIFMNITTADVQRVARTYFTETNRTVLYIVPEARRAEELSDEARRPSACVVVAGVHLAAASLQPSELAARSAAASVAGARGQVSALRDPDAGERPAGHRRAASRAAGGQRCACWFAPAPRRIPRRRAASRT